MPKEKEETNFLYEEVKVDGTHGKERRKIKEETNPRTCLDCLGRVNEEGNRKILLMNMWYSIEEETTLLKVIPPL